MLRNGFRNLARRISVNRRQGARTSEHPPTYNEVLDRTGLSSASRTPAYSTGLQLGHIRLDAAGNPIQPHRRSTIEEEEEDEEDLDEEARRQATAGLRSIFSAAMGYNMAFYRQNTHPSV